MQEDKNPDQKNRGLSNETDVTDGRQDHDNRDEATKTKVT